MTLGINNLGVVTGFYFDSSGVTHAFIDVAGRLTTFDDSSAGTGPQEGTQFYGLNDFGAITGMYWGSDTFGHGFLDVAGRLTPISDPNGIPVGFEPLAWGPDDINDAGVVVGGYYTSGASGPILNGFSLTPGH